MISYSFVKHLHILCVTLSFTGFCMRGWWMATGSPRLTERWVRVLPHAIDTLLLASALTLALWSGQYPFVEGWLTAKVVGLLAYIGCGTVALKRGSTPRIRLAFLLIALGCFAYIVGVALTRSPYLAW